MAKTISKELKEIATRYAINDEKQIEEILTAMPITNIDKPTEEQVKGFERVCALLQSGKKIKEAIETVNQESKQSKTAKNSEANGSSRNAPESSQGELSQESMDDIVVALAKRAAYDALANLPNIAIGQKRYFEALFIQEFRKYMAMQLQDPNFVEQVKVAIETGDVGKLRLFSTTNTNMALPSASSSTN